VSGCDSGSQDGEGCDCVVVASEKIYLLALAFAWQQGAEELARAQRVVVVGCDSVVWSASVRGAWFSFDVAMRGPGAERGGVVWGEWMEVALWRRRGRVGCVGREAGVVGRLGSS
jgi:hypothetical protein